MNDCIHSHSAALPLDTVHSVLKNRRRRFVVDVLAGREAPIDLRVLARAISERLPAEDTEETQSDRLDRITIALHHVDLPKLEQADLVAYDREATVVEPRGVEQLAPFLEAADALQ